MPNHCDPCKPHVCPKPSANSGYCNCGQTVVYKPTPYAKTCTRTVLQCPPVKKCVKSCCPPKKYC